MFFCKAVSLQEESESESLPHPNALSSWSNHTHRCAGLPLNAGIGRKAPYCCSFVDVVGGVRVAAEIVVNQTWGKKLIKMHESCIESEFVLPECQGISHHFVGIRGA